MIRSFATSAVILLAAQALAGPLKFRVQEFETTLKVGYGVVVTDVNGDKKPDIVVADANRVVWYENPRWNRRTMIEGAVPPDIVCIAPCDIDRNGTIDFFVGADWGRMDTTQGGTIHWMRRGKTLDDPWEVFKIGEEPTVHRIKVLNRDFGSCVVVAPLMGRGATKERNWMDGRPVRLLRYWIPKDPVLGPWPADVMDEQMHVVHGIDVSDGGEHWRLMVALVASYEGVTLVGEGSGVPWRVRSVVDGDQSNPKASRGASEVKDGRVTKDNFFVATVEPWHGNQIVVYPRAELDGPLSRHVIDDKLRWGHALWCADLDGDGSDEIIAGVRDDLSKEPGERRGVRVYKCTDDKGTQWDRQIVEDGGVACEDLMVADLDGDGRPDIIAVGRQTGNGRIYWNLGR